MLSDFSHLISNLETIHELRHLKDTFLSILFDIWPFHYFDDLQLFFHILFGPCLPGVDTHNFHEQLLSSCLPLQTALLANCCCYATNGTKLTGFADALRRKAKSCLRIKTVSSWTNNTVVKMAKISAKWTRKYLLNDAVHGLSRTLKSSECHLRTICPRFTVSFCKN